MKLKVKLFLVIIFLFATNTVLALENKGSVSTAMAGAGAASVNLSDGYFLNPALISLYPAKSLTLASSFRTEKASLVDHGQEALFPLAVSYNQNDLNGTKNKTYSLGSAYLYKEKFSVGVGLQFKEMKNLQTDQIYRQNLVDIGFVFVPQEWLSFGLVVRAKPLNDIELVIPVEQKSTVAVASDLKVGDYLNSRFELEQGENAQNQKKMIVKLGFEIIANEWVLLRAGYQNNNLISQNYLTAGLGFGGPQFGLHYSYIKEAEMQKESFHSIDLTVPF